MLIYNIRPHHGLCAQFFEGKGYNAEFIRHMTGMLRDLSGQSVRLVLQTDAICQACPNQENQLCLSQSKVMQYDRQVLKLCGLQAYTVIGWQDFLNLIQKNIIRKGRLPDICPDCQWFRICSAKAEKAVQPADG